MKQQPVL